MSDQNSEGNDRMERLLRQWGAEEDARRQPAGAPPLERWRRAQRRAALARWLPVAASLALFAATAALVTGSRALAPRGAETEALRTELDRTAGELHQAQASLAGAARLLDQEKRQRADDVATLRRELDVQKAALAAKATQDQAAFKNLATSLQERDEALAALQRSQTAQREAALQELRKQYDGLAAETARLRKAEESAVAARRETAAKLAAVEAEQASVMAMLQRAALAAAAPGEEGIRTLQRDARARGLLRRGAELRGAVPDAAVQRLFDTHEALLTQLDLLDAGDRSETEAFVRRVREMDLGLLLDKALRSTDQAPAVRAWLIETQLLLAGVKRAG